MCRSVLQAPGEFISHDQLARRRFHLESGSELHGLPSDTATALMGVDRSVYAAAASSLLTFVMCNTVWKNSSRSDDPDTQQNLMPLVRSSNSIKSAGDHASPATMTLPSPVDASHVQEEDIWEVARSGLLEVGPRPGSAVENDRSPNQACVLIPTGPV